MKHFPIALALAVAVGFLGVSHSAQASSSLKAAAVSVDITPPVGVPLGGYGARRKLSFPGTQRYAQFLKPSTGLIDPIFAKILVLENGRNKLAMVAYDLVGASADLRKDITKYLSAFGFSKDQVVVSATHTHSGPGTISKNWVWEIGATDKFSPQVYGGVLEATENGLLAAMLSLEPASLSTYSFDGVGLTHNRRGHDERLDPRANILLVRNGVGDVLGGIANFAVHGTALSSDNLLYSADAPGAMRARFEEELDHLNSVRASSSPSILFINSAEGDIAPAKNKVEGMRILGDSFAQMAIQAMVGERPLDPVWSSTHANVKLGRPMFGLKACLEKYEEFAFLGKGLMPLISTAFPSEAEISAIHLGDLLWLTWPGEPTTVAGWELKKVGLAAGAKDAWVFGLTNDHLSYFTMPDEYAEGKYEACGSLYGAQGAVHMIDGFKTLLGVSP